MTFPFKELKSGSGLPVFRGKVIVVRAILETKKQQQLINKRYVIFNKRDRELQHYYYC